MTSRSSFRFGAIALIALFAVASSAFAQLADNVPAGIRISKDMGRADTSAEIKITVHFKLKDKAAFDRAVDALYDPASPTYHKWMTNEDLRKFGPTEAQRETVRKELQRNGLTILTNDKIGFTVRARGSVAKVERAFNTELHNFQYKGKTFRANIRPARLGGEAGNYVHTVAGLESHQVRPMYTRAFNAATHKPFPSIAMSSVAGTGFPPLSTNECLTTPITATLKNGSALPVATYSGAIYSPDPSIVCDYVPEQLWTAIGLDQVFAAGLNGAGQTIVLVEGFGYPTMIQDANTFSHLANILPLTSSNFKVMYPEGKPNPQLGILTGWNTEIALDIDWSHSVAPGAKIVVLATTGQDNEDFQHTISFATENDLGNSISNSYEEDLDLLAGKFEQTSWDNVLEVATAKGISVNFSTGDSGDNGVGVSFGAPGVPSVAPHATAVGGTSILNDPFNPGNTITTAWGDTLVALELGGDVADPPFPFGLQGGGGGGQSSFWPKPSWQSRLPGTGRQVPDVSALSDPFTGVPIVLTDGGEQFIEYGWGGTSLGCPIFSAFWALANEKAGHPLGQAARAIANAKFGTVQDVVFTSTLSANNVSGSIKDSSGTTKFSAADIFGADLVEGNKGFTSVLWPIDSGDIFDFGFGLDSSLTVRKGWDNATGFGTPIGMTFINGVTK